MTASIIISLCFLLLMAYVFDLSAPKTRIPSVILLLALGFGVRQLVNTFQLSVPDLSELLPLLGTVGLILIVLEGSLELEFNKSKLPLIKKSFYMALFPMLVLAFGISAVMSFVGQTDYKMTLANVIPLCVISSAIAIPSVRNMGKFQKEFVTYESSLSDILGVLFFNFVALNAAIDGWSVLHFLIQLLLIAMVSLVATVALSFMLSRLNHHIKYGPIILIVVLIYGLCKLYHLPGLVFIMGFGLFLGNVRELERYSLFQRFRPDILKREVHKFHELTVEAAFLIRASFFLLFGFMLETSEILNWHTAPWALGIAAAIFVVRAIQLIIQQVPVFPLVFVAPRGLITVLLFLSLTPEQFIPLANKSLVVQVVLLSAVVLMFGSIVTPRRKNEALSSFKQ